MRQSCVYIVTAGADLPIEHFQTLQHELPGIMPVSPERGKVARVAAVSPLIEVGNVYLPPLYSPWVNDFIEMHRVPQ